jgi:hypothetical protein
MLRRNLNGWRTANMGHQRSSPSRLPSVCSSPNSRRNRCSAEVGSSVPNPEVTLGGEKPLTIGTPKFLEHVRHASQHHGS